MRKSRVKTIADTIFWYTIYLFPIITYFLLMLSTPGSNSTTAIEFETFFSNIGLQLATDNIVVNSIETIIGKNGIIPLFATKTPIIIVSWFICTYIIHLIVDTLLFIPRFAHKFIEKTTQGE